MKEKTKLKWPRSTYLANLNARRHSKNWETFIVCCDSFQRGYNQGICDFKSGLTTDKIEVEYTPGDGQLSDKRLLDYRVERENMQLEEAMKIYLEYFTEFDVKVHTDENGLISFQGTCKRNKV